ncbi:MAG: DUF4974 domain-containing protein [Bacteroidetes bacterium]|nr:DUF4974 domain-containing protein [Bacteroidota bacterium]
MNEELYISLLQKQLSDTLSPAEQSTLEDWLEQSADNQLIAKQVAQAWQLSGGFSQDVDLDADADFERLERRIAEAEATPAAKVVTMKPKRNWLAIAAAIALLVAAPLVLRKFFSSPEMGQFATTDSPALHPVELADGSKVWLNAHSSLQFFTKNEGDKREIKLTGEAFFEVAKNPERPFVVTTELGQVTVLGTSFNVRNPAGSTSLEVNVSTGKVKVQPKGSSEHLLLLPNETGIFDQNKNSLVKTGGVANNTAAWHTEKLVFDNTPLEEVLHQLSLLHGVTLTIENQAVARCPLTVVFEKQGLEATLETIQTLLGAELVKVSEKDYRIRGGRCG